MVQKIVFVTGNANKLREVEMLLAPAPNEQPVLKLTNTEIDLPEVQSDSLEEIARTKVSEAMKHLPRGQAVFVEDTALCFDEYNGLPGAYIKWFLKNMGPDKIVHMLDGFENKGAEAITTVAYGDSEGNIHIFKGVTKGKIVPPRGSRNFGWDCLFEPVEGSGATYAEMEKADKNKISQRSKAFMQLKEYLYSHSKQAK